MPVQKTTRVDALEKLFGVFRKEGFDGASLTELADAVGLQRASLYHLFPGGKAEMAAAVIGHVDRQLQRECIEPLRADGAPSVRVHAFVATLRDFYCGGTLPCLLEAITLGKGGALFGDAVAGAMSDLCDALAKLSRDAGLPPKLARVRATEALVQIQGALVVARGMQETALFDAALKRVPPLLLKR